MCCRIWKKILRDYTSDLEHSEMKSRRRYSPICMVTCSLGTLKPRALTREKQARIVLRWESCLSEAKDLSSNFLNAQKDVDEKSGYMLEPLASNPVNQQERLDECLLVENPQRLHAGSRRRRERYSPICMATCRSRSHFIGPLEF